MSLLLVQLLNGLANAMFLFLIASGLSLIFGVTRIVNFAHGSFYMLAAYVTYSLTAALPLGAVWRGCRVCGASSRRGRLLRGRPPGGARDRRARRTRGRAPAPPGVPRARALSAPPDLRAGPGRRGRRALPLGSGQQDGAH